MLALIFPPLNPVAFSFGPIEIRWYALAYLAGFLIGWAVCLRLARQNPNGPGAQDYDDFLTWGVIGTVLGGRIGYILIYQPDYYFAHPLQMLEVWHGGMSFHGGMLGVILAALFFARRRKLNFLGFTDVLACVVPIGLGLGRIANFINGELFGRPTDMPWGMIFPRGGDVPRHPSQLYEAFMEGLVLFLIMLWLSQKKSIRARPGFLSGAFLMLYGLFRFGLEFFRQPDPQLGLIWEGLSMGQLLCIPMMLFGIYLIFYSERRVKPRPPASP
ncbi:MAG TPA: prolipoprotein diacylglyceryl transferase [Alphaproteobacteria bacterium]|nr:prolipoprotein diacylglyceryl transferase [Alphaproteobacteria bacterium]